VAKKRDRWNVKEMVGFGKSWMGQERDGWLKWLMILNQNIFKREYNNQ